MSRRLLAGLALAAALAAPCVRAADEPSAALESAVELYEKGDHAGAEAAFRALVESGHGTANVYFDLGNAAYRQGRWPMAVLAYEAARELAPNDGDVQQALELARRNLVTDVVGTQIAPETRRILDALRGVPLRVTLPAFLVLWTVGWLLILVRVWRRSGGWAAGGAACLVVSLVLGGHVAWAVVHARGPERAVLQAAQVEVKSGPGTSYTTLFVLHAGCLVEVEESREGWRRIRVPRGPSGWVPESGAALLFDPATWPALPPPS